MSTLEFYREQAERCRSMAADATLDNIRDRNLGAAEAFEALADRIIRTSARRDLNEAAKARATTLEVATADAP